MDLINSMPDFKQLSKKFLFVGSFIRAELIDNGHIHKTYLLYFDRMYDGIGEYILQEINTNVFRSPELVMENILMISRYLREKVTELGGDPDRETITLVPTITGEYLYKSEDGQYWRAMTYIRGTKTYIPKSDKRSFLSASRAFSHFQKLLVDFPANRLHLTIPDFHNTPKRFEAFTQAIDKDHLNRSHIVKNEINYILKREREASILIDLHERGEIPLRVTHNDTKLENVLFDTQSGEGICVIDLDTVMPGLFLYDFGDTVRSAANTGAEDESDLRKVHFSPEIFKLLVQGYLSEMHEELTPAEIEHLAFGAKLIIFEQAIRFLADFINGDIYYRIHHPRQNLDRCRTQLKLIKEFEFHQTAIERAVMDVIKRGVL